MRHIYTVDATQIVTSAANPWGVYSHAPNYPKVFDSRSYGASTENPDGNPELALIVAQADFADQVKQLSLANNPARAAWCVTLTRAIDGVQLARKSFGAFPNMTPASEPEAGEEE